MEDLINEQILENIFEEIQSCDVDFYAYRGV